MSANKRKKVLFLCTGNSARSQMAEALMRHFRGDEFEVFSAGVEPKGVHPKTIEVLREIGIDVSGQKSKHMDDLPTKDFDYIITLCEQRGTELPGLFGKRRKDASGICRPGRSARKRSGRF